MKRPLLWLLPALAVFLVLCGRAAYIAVVLDDDGGPPEPKPNVGPSDGAAAESGKAGKPAAEPIVNAIGMKLVRIEPGEFVMGSDFKPADGPKRPVKITRAFHMGVYEVTQGEYEKVSGGHRSWFHKDGARNYDVEGLDTSRFPVENVTWEEAAAFCRKLSDRPAEKAAGRVYRLPTEAEWEYACRAGTTTHFHYGDSLSSKQACFDGSHPFGAAPAGVFLKRTMAVGSFAPNAWGLYDMHGNVREWCSDWYAADAYRTGPNVDPSGPAQGRTKVQRGGGYYFAGVDCRSAFRSDMFPDWGDDGTGFRVACDIVEK
jgi:formylglycine-generating enzyme required for sulfatase activity